MPTYDLKCNMCGFEEERILPITRDLEDRPLGCTNMEVECAGIMEKVYRVPPTVHQSAFPTRRRDDGVKYSDNGPRERNR